MASSDFEERNAAERNRVGKLVRLGLWVFVGIFLLLTAMCQIPKHLATVEGGTVGVMFKKYGSHPGVQPEALTPKTYFLGFGEKVTLMSTIQRTYSYTREKNQDGNENEEIIFADNNGQAASADVQLVVRIDPAKAPALYNQYKTDLTGLLENAIRNDVRTFIAEETEKTIISDLYKGGRQPVIQRARLKLAQKWDPQGVKILQLDWIGKIRFPDSLTDSIEAKTKAEADVISAEAQTRVAEANANKLIAEARGIAESTRLRGEALKQNPAYIDEILAKRSQGLCPPGTKTCIIGGDAVQQIAPAD